MSSKLCCMFNQYLKTMKATKNTQTQEVKEEKKVIPQNSEQAQKLLNKAEQSKKQSTTTKPVTQRATSMEVLATELRKKKADEPTIIKTFTTAYKVKGITDKAFITKRIAIYLKIADKRLAKA